ncbi:MAG: phage tail tape measure protein, partial [Synergistaceae bacterium]|nr:phage tail tape measure protein [Synergistaceae bacterium]
MSVLNVKIGVLTAEFENKLARSEKDIQKFSKKVNSELSKIGKGFEPFKNLAISAIAAANEVKDALNDLALGTGATGEALQGLKDDFRAVAAQVPDSMSASAKAVADLNTMLGISGSDVQKLAVKFLDLSRITKSDLGVNISSVTKLMNKWGLETTQGAEILDKLLVASQSTGVSIDKLASGVTSQGDALRAMGFNLDESIALFGQLDKLGDDAGAVFRSLNFAMKNFAKDGITDFAAAFRDVFNEIKSSPTLDGAVNKVSEIFGSVKDPAVKLATAIRAGRLEVGDLVGAMNEAGGALDTFTAEAETFADGWARIRNQVTLALEPLGAHILKIASEYLPALSSGVNGVAIDFDDWV